MLRLSFLSNKAEKVHAVAEDVKNIGNNFFKTQKWESAMKKYSKALR